jgi:hypothetical protein
MLSLAQLRDALQNGRVFKRGTPIKVTIPQMAMPNIVFADEVHETVVPIKPKKKYRSIDDPWEA